MTNALVNLLFGRAERVRRDNPLFHEDCSACCSAGSCHWCLSKVGKAIVVGTVRKHKGLTYRMCRVHYERFLDDPHSPFGGTQQAAFTVVPVVMR